MTWCRLSLMVGDGTSFERTDMYRHTRFLYGVAAVHSLGALSLWATAIVLGWPWPVYIVVALALIIAVAVAAVSSP